MSLDDVLMSIEEIYDDYIINLTREEGYGTADKVLTLFNAAYREINEERNKGIVEEAIKVIEDKDSMDESDAKEMFDRVIKAIKDDRKKK
jgi:hypothetical protein